MKPASKDYLPRIWRAVTAVIALLVAVSFIPPQTIGGVALRRANILSDLVQFDDRAATKESEAETPLFDEEEFQIDIEEVAQQIVVDTLPPPVERHFHWAPYPGHVAASVRNLNPAPFDAAQHTITPIEPADTLLGVPFQAFCDTLLMADRPVRIAVLGDSFIEGDILTADLRERMQLRYGGGGPGFTPMASPLTAFRRTVKTQAKGWTTYNIMQRKATPESLQASYYLSGWVATPSSGAETRWEMTDARKGLKDCRTARIWLLSPRDSRVVMTLNDSLRHDFALAGDGAVRQIAIEAPQIRSLALRVTEPCEGFIGYGAAFEGGGVEVDNYSVRSNNGQAMFRTNPSINAQINALGAYDLVILQYGLNIMQAGVTNYTSYGRQIEKMVAFVRECFPGAAVLVMGVSDRSVKSDAGFEPMDAIPHMLGYQRRAAHAAGAAFWSTCDAMRNEGGMAVYVQNGWAGKDYTHINFAGGRRVAHALADAIDAAVEERRTAHRLEEQRRREQFLLDSARRAEIDRQLRMQPIDSLELPNPLQP